jgi:replication factor A1
LKGGNNEMAISELRAGQGNVNVQGTITEVGEIRTFNKFGRELKVANAILKDDSGTIKLTLWNDEADKHKEGDEIQIENGYVNEFQGEPQLTAGKFGKIVLLGEGSGDKAEAQSEIPSGDESDSTEDEAPVEEAKEEVPVEEIPTEEAPAEETEKQEEN